MLLEMYAGVPETPTEFSSTTKKFPPWDALAFFPGSKNFPTYPWNIPQTPNQQFMKEFLSFEGLGKPGVCSRGMLGFP